MTKIHRQDSPAELADTHQRFLVSTEGMDDAETYQHYKKNKNYFQYNTAETKLAFQQMNSKRCSFCTKFISDFDTEMTVEHIQLKSVCPRKIFLWSNLLCACRTCNTKRSTKAYDKARYLDPTEEEDVAAYFRFALDGQIEVNKELDPAQQEKAKYMIDLYCLNRKMLVCERRDFFAALMADDEYYNCLTKQGISSQSIIFWATFTYYKRSREQNGC
jgi:uncharacterized protein (TIGR02646 family)